VSVSKNSHLLIYKSRRASFIVEKDAKRYTDKVLATQRRRHKKLLPVFKNKTTYLKN